MAAGRRWQRDAAKERHWRRVLRAWRRSGLNVREFCDWQSLSEPSFYSWRREIAKRDGEAVAARPRKGNSGQSRPGENGAAAFLPVRVVVEESGRQSGGEQLLEVRLPTGVQLRVPAGFDRQTLLDVLAAVEKPPC